MASPPLVAWMNPLPVELAPALGDRRREVARAAKGKVLDLGGWADHLDGYPIGSAVESVTMLDRAGDVRAGSGDSDPSGVTRLDAGVDALVELGHGPFDTVVSLIRTPLVADLHRFITAVLELLAPAGHLHFLEPVCRSGRAGRLLAIGGRMGRAAGGLHLDRDIPAKLRNRGLTITDLERFEVPTLSAPLRPWVQGRARRPLSSPGS